MSYASYVALGDSFTEGLDDPDPTGDGFRGWADLVAHALAASTSGEFRYANLAIRGRLLKPIVNEQLPVAEELRPELISLAGGTNDILRRNCDLELLKATFRDAVRRLRATGADVIVFAGTDPSRRLPSSRRLVPRIRIMNDVVRRTADEHGCLLVDLWPEPAFDDPRVWSVDRLHLNTRGHQIVAAHVLRALGYEHHDGWFAPLPPAAPPRWVNARASDVQWVRRHFAPWVYRRLTGKSSGDTVTPKRPRLEPL